MPDNSDYPRAKCIPGSGDIIPEPLSKIGSTISIISAAGGAAGTIYKGSGLFVDVINGPLIGGAFAGAAGAIAVIGIVSTYWYDRCYPREGLQECVAGVVSEIKQSFSDVLENLLPFTAMHDRVDVVVKSKYWRVAEDAEAKAFCTKVEGQRRSEIMRCYFYTPKVCNAMAGAFTGAVAGSIPGVLLAAYIAALIGCSSVILCLFALLLAVLIAAGFALAGAIAGGAVANAVSDRSMPASTEGTPVNTGALISVHGNMVRREFDENANVFWFVKSSSLSGRVPDSVPDNPYSHCDIDEVFIMHECDDNMIY